MAKKKISESDSRPNVARAYIRVSHIGDKSKVPGGGAISPGMQLDEARNYAALYLKDHVFDADASTRHADIDTSATRIKWQKRLGLVAHLEAAQRGEFNALIVFKLSRLARNAREGLELFELFEQAGCSIHCIKEHIDTNTPQGRMVRTLLLAVAEMEAENTSEFVKSASKARALKGLPHGTVPFWITRDPDSGYVLNERAGDVRKLIELRLQGLGQAAIARKLNAVGIASPGKGRWTAQKAGRYLHEHGLSLLQGHYTFGVDCEEGDPDRVFVPNAFPAVITQDEAEQVLTQNRMMREMYTEGGPRRAAYTTYVLSGVFRCGTCGAPMISHTSYPKNGPHRMGYHCRKSKEDTTPHPFGNFVSGEMAEDAVMRAILLAAHDYKEQFANPPPLPDTSDNGSAIDKHIRKLTDKISRLVDALSDGMLKREDFQPRYDALVTEREQLQESLRETDSSAAIRMVMNEAFEAVSRPKLTVEQARRLVLACVKRVDGPVDVEPKLIGLPKAKRGRAVCVTLNIPLATGATRILAPLYDARFKGTRILLDPDQERTLSPL